MVTGCGQFKELYTMFWYIEATLEFASEESATDRRPCGWHHLRDNGKIPVVKLCGECAILAGAKW